MYTPKMEGFSHQTLANDQIIPLINLKKKKKGGVGLPVLTQDPV